MITVDQIQKRFIILDEMDSLLLRDIHQIRKEKDELFIAYWDLIHE